MTLDDTTLFFDGTFDVAANYTPANGAAAYSVQAIIDEGREPAEDGALAKGPAVWATVWVRASEVVLPAYQDTITHRGLTWRVTSIAVDSDCWKLVCAARNRGDVSARG